MGSDSTIDVTVGSGRLTASAASLEGWALVLAWVRDEPGRAGEVALVDGSSLLGRGHARADDDGGRLVWVRQRPDRVDRCPPLSNPRISRRQLVLEPTADGVTVENVGRCPLWIDGERCKRAEVGVGATLRLADELVLLVSRRPALLPALRSYPRELPFDFAAPDADGVVGESVAAWRLRDELAFAARSDAHLLLYGPSGAGKELAARCIHRLSTRAGGPLIARNAATFPVGIIDAELFGNIRDYPNPGTPEREGLIGSADGGILFLDEIGELPPHLQAHLLRVLDAGGDYQRLGETVSRRADLRMVAATNRDPGELKHDFAARLSMRIRVPALSERRDDIPLLVSWLLGRLAASHPDIAEDEVRVDASLMAALLRHDYRLQVRELEQILWTALAERSGDMLTLSPGVAELLAPVPDPDSDDPEPAAEPERDAIEAALAAHGRSVTAAARALGLKNRYVLYRLMRKHGL